MKPTSNALVQPNSLNAVGGPIVNINGEQLRRPKANDKWHAVRGRGGDCGHGASNPVSNNGGKMAKSCKTATSRTSTPPPPHAMNTFHPCGLILLHWG